MDKTDNERFTQKKSYEFWLKTNIQKIYRSFCRAIWSVHKAIEMCRQSTRHTVRTISLRDFWLEQHHIALEQHKSSFQLKLSQRIRSASGVRLEEMKPI